MEGLQFSNRRLLVDGTWWNNIRDNAICHPFCHLPSSAIYSHNDSAKDSWVTHQPPAKTSSRFVSERRWMAWQHLAALWDLWGNPQNFRRSSALAMLSLCAPQSQHERWSLDFEFSNLFHHLKAKRFVNSPTKIGWKYWKLDGSTWKISRVSSL